MSSSASFFEMFPNLFPICSVISPRPGGGENILQRLRAIVERANGLGIRAEWVVEEPPKGKVGEFAPGVLNELWSHWLGSRNRILRIGSWKFSVRHDWTEESGPRLYYLTVMDALEDVRS